MEKKFLINDCSLIPSEGSSLKKEFNIAGGNPTITYFESIKSPAISLSLNFMDVDQLISREGITGGEYIDVIVLDGEEDQFEISSKKHKLVLNSVRNMVTERHLIKRPGYCTGCSMTGRKSHRPIYRTIDIFGVGARWKTAALVKEQDK